MKSSPDIVRTDTPVDAVIIWVDGNDPVLNAKRAQWAPEGALENDNQGGRTRYADCGEIHWCVRSIRRFAPWIRRIFILTDGQDPHIEDGAVPVQIIDHKDVFRGMEQYLPVFNATAIESMIWRIPGLSERFIYFNDDFFIAKPVSPADFFTDEGVVCYARPFSVPLERVLKRLHRDKTHFSFKGMMYNTARLTGESKRFWRYDHTPRGLLRSFYEQCFSEHPQWLEQNLRFRFRDPAQFSMEELLYLDLSSRGKLKVLPAEGNLFFWRGGGSKKHFARKYSALLETECKFAAFNSIDKLDPDDARKVFEWMDSTLGSA